MQTLADCPRYWARFRADDDAIVSGETRYSWRDFARRVEALSAALQAMGVRRGDRVAILLVSSAEWAVAFAAIPTCGAVIVPLNPRFGSFELRGIEEDAECAAIITTRADAVELQDRFELGAGDAAEIILAVRRGGPAPVTLAQALQHSGPTKPVSVAPDDLAAIFYTSGTTGRPKGTMHTHVSILTGVFGQMLGLEITSADRALIMAPLAFTGACLSLLAPMIIAGGCAVIEPAYDPVCMLHLIERERITFITNVPAIWERLPTLAEFPAADFSSLRMTLTGGAPVSVSLLDSFRCKDIVIRQCYGATEGGGMLSYPTRALALAQPSSAGWAQSTVDLKIETAEGRACAPGEVGEVLVRGPQIMKGYWRNPGADAESFRDGWYRTGDLASRDADGCITVVDRMKNMIISGGVNIYPAEIERAMSAIPTVDEVGVFGEADPRWGERAVALIHGAAPIDLDAVTREARRLLGDFKTPREIVVSPTPLPRTVTNKIARKDLPALYRSCKGA